MANPKLQWDPNFTKDLEELSHRIQNITLERARVLGENHINLNGPVIEYSNKTVSIFFLDKADPDRHSDFFKISFPVAGYVVERGDHPGSFEALNLPLVLKPTFFRDCSEIKPKLTSHLDAIEEETRVIQKTSDTFGFSIQSPNSSSQAFPGNSLYFSTSSPRKTVTLYRGVPVHASSRATANNNLREATEADLKQAIEKANMGLYSQTPEQRKAFFEEVKAMTPKEKLLLFGKQKLRRIMNSSQYPSCFFGGTKDFKTASYFGNVVFEVEVPEKAVWANRDVFYNEGEKEQFIPFGIHPEWIKKIWSTDKKLLWERK